MLNYARILPVLIVVAVAAMFIFSAACTSPKPTATPAAVPPTSGEVNISVSNFSFSPETITVPAGTTVVWTNKDSVSHNVVSDASGAFESGLLGQSVTFKYTFTESGAFPYHCEPHPFMKGTVFVQ